MTAGREAFTLPLMFLTVAFAGGLRIGPRVELLPPSLFSLILALLSVAALVRSGALAPLRLMNSGRTALANLNGLAVLVTLAIATAQVFALVTPDWGLPRVTFSVFFFILLLNTHAAAPDRPRAIRSFAVILGAAFILKFIVLAALSDPAQGRLARVLQALLEGVTLGTIAQPVYHAVTGYAAFLTLVLYLAALVMLPAEGATGERPSALSRGRDRARLSPSHTPDRRPA